MALAQGPAENKQKEIQRDWPNEEGLTTPTQTQVGRQSILQFQEGSNVRSRNLELI